MLNKGVERYSDWGNSGRSMIRVHDSRGFEFEITVDNLIGILMHSDVSKREIDAQCVFAWWGTELVLLPTNSEEYQASLAFTSNQSEKLSTKYLVPGRVYKRRKLTRNSYILVFGNFGKSIRNRNMSEIDMAPGTIVPVVITKMMFHRSTRERSISSKDMVVDTERPPFRKSSRRRVSAFFFLQWPTISFLISPVEWRNLSIPSMLAR